MKHIDLFSGIGGFALAADYVFGEVEHTFVEVDPFCQQVLKKHWPEATIYGDIKTFTNTASDRLTRRGATTSIEEGHEPRSQEDGELAGRPERPYSILTGGFPCQPFSAAGRRQGTDDNRYLWPEMFRVIREFQPEWVIAENVYGLVTWNEGMVLEQVCTDLESEGYEVQPFIIPAVSVNAPHRRDRVWIIANRRPQRRNEGGEGLRPPRKEPVPTHPSIMEWNKNWVEVATELCGVDDGLPVELDGFKLTKAGHRKERLKALGNAIVPQVAIQILKQMKGRQV